jgi:hypothetical protein
MATNLKKSLDNLKDACMLHAYNLDLIGGDGETICNEIKIDNFTLGHVRTLDNDDIDMLTDVLINYGLEEVKRVFSEISPCDVFGEYVKDSYMSTYVNLNDLLKVAIKGCGYAQDKWQGVFDERINHEYKSTESAFLYNGYYITPYILTSLINKAWSELTKENQKEYLNKFYNGNKVKVNEIANDCLFDMFNNDSIERLTVMEGLRSHEGIGV